MPIQRKEKKYKIKKQGEKDGVPLAKKIFCKPNLSYLSNKIKRIQYY